MSHRLFTKVREISRTPIGFRGLSIGTIYRDRRGYVCCKDSHTTYSIVGRSNDGPTIPKDTEGLYAFDSYVDYVLPGTYKEQWK